jgi:hypothetical protein
MPKQSFDVISASQRNLGVSESNGHVPGPALRRCKFVCWAPLTFRCFWPALSTFSTRSSRTPEIGVFSRSLLSYAPVLLPIPCVNLAPLRLITYHGRENMASIASRLFPDVSGKKKNHAQSKPNKVIAAKKNKGCHGLECEEHLRDRLRVTILNSRSGCTWQF